MSQVVVPLDGSMLAEAALPYGAALAKQFGVPLALIWAMPLPRVPDLSYVPKTIGLQHQPLSTRASQYLKEHIDRLSSDGLKVTEHVVNDRPAHVIPPAG